MQWTGRTEGNTGVIFDKGTAQPKDIVDILIQDAQGVSLFGKRVLKKEKIFLQKNLMLQQRKKVKWDNVLD